jgi:hypothetical protein
MAGLVPDIRQRPLCVRQAGRIQRTTTRYGARYDVPLIRIGRSISRVCSGPSPPSGTVSIAIG